MKETGFQAAAIYATGDDPEVGRTVTQRLDDTQAGHFLHIDIRVGVAHQKVSQTLR